jgi:hypothetical protein
VNVPEVVGVPLMLSILEAQVAAIPGGNPEAIPIPVALAVVWVMAGSELLTHTVGEAEAELTV